METSMYYTFSTIAQVLAAFIALSGVFLIFKIQELKKMQFLQVQYFYNYASGIVSLNSSSFHGCVAIAVKLKTLHQSECLAGMLKEMDLILDNSVVQNSAQLKSLKRMHNIFQKIDRRRKHILLLAKISIISGVITILLSVSILTMVTRINISQSIILFIIGLLGTFASIMLMTITIFKSLQEINLIELETDNSLTSRVSQNPQP